MIIAPVKGIEAHMIQLMPLIYVPLREIVENSAGLQVSILEAYACEK